MLTGQGTFAPGQRLHRVHPEAATDMGRVFFFWDVMVILYDFMVIYIVLMMINGDLYALIW